MWTSVRGSTAKAFRMRFNNDNSRIITHAKSSGNYRDMVDLIYEQFCSNGHHGIRDVKVMLIDRVNNERELMVKVSGPLDLGHGLLMALMLMTFFGLKIARRACATDFHFILCSIIHFVKRFPLRFQRACIIIFLICASAVCS